MPDNETKEGALENRRAGMVAVVGRTNAGKSTLVNSIIGEKISIVTPVVQTTRNNIRGILTDERGQLVLIDTPGLHKSQTKLCTAMNKMARAAVDGVDLVLLVFDGSRVPEMEDEGWMRRLLFMETPCIFLLNKTDVGSHKDLFREMWERLKAEKGQAKDNVEWRCASAHNGDGVPGLVSKLFESLPVGPLLFDEEMLTDFPRKLAVADIIREKLFMMLDDEMPHEVGVKVDDIVQKPGAWDVTVTIMVNRASQKGIVIGEKGRTLRSLRRKSELELSNTYDVKAKVEFWVKIEKNWYENFFLLRQMGYV